MQTDTPTPDTLFFIIYRNSIWEMATTTTMTMVFPSTPACLPVATLMQGSIAGPIHNGCWGKRKCPPSTSFPSFPHHSVQLGLICSQVVRLHPKRKLQRETSTVTIISSPAPGKGPPDLSVPFLQYFTWWLGRLKGGSLSCSFRLWGWSLDVQQLLLSPSTSTNGFLVVSLQGLLGEPSCREGGWKKTVVVWAAKLNDSCYCCVWAARGFRGWANGLLGACAPSAAHWPLTDLCLSF